MNQEVHNGRSVAAVLNDMKEELKEFAETRLEMLKAEMRQKFQSIKSAAPLAAAGILMLATAYLLLTLAVVALIVAVFPANPYRWFFGFAGVGLAWAILGAGAAYMAKREVEMKGLLPKKTIEVLKGDKIWIQSEVKNQL